MKINKEVKIERAHPLEKNTVMVKFLSFKDRDLVMSRARNLKGSDPPLFVRDDVSEACKKQTEGTVATEEFIERRPQKSCDTIRQAPHGCQYFHL